MSNHSLSTIPGYQILYDISQTKLEPVRLGILQNIVQERALVTRRAKTVQMTWFCLNANEPPIHLSSRPTQAKRHTVTLCTPKPILPALRLLLLLRILLRRALPFLQLLLRVLLVLRSLWVLLRVTILSRNPQRGSRRPDIYAL